MASTSDPPYTGPSVAQMLATHTLAQNIITYHAHPTSSAILDDSELALLHRFASDPTPSTRDAILAENGIDGNGEAMPKGEQSLVAYLVFEHGAGRKNLLDEGEIVMLREWFERGGEKMIW